MSHLEEKFAAAWPTSSVQPIRQYRFDELGFPDGRTDKHGRPKLRQWKFDFAWPEYRVAVEIQGGMFVAGRHNRGGALAVESEKMRAACKQNWLVLPITTKEITKARLPDMVAEVLYVLDARGPQFRNP